MKKLITFFCSLGLLTSSLSTVISCSLDSSSYDGLFKEEGNNSSDDNNDKFIYPGLDEIREQIKKIINQTIIADIQIRENDGLLNSKIMLTDKEIAFNLQKYFENISGMNEKDKGGKTLLERGFSLEILSEENQLIVPTLKGISDDGKTFFENASVEMGRGIISINYLGNKLEQYNFNWNVTEYSIIESIINALQVNSFENPDSYSVRNIDLELFMGLTIGGITSLINLFNVVSDVNTFNNSDSRAGLNDILEKIKPLVKPLQNIVNLNVDELSFADPDSVSGKRVYENFDKNFRQNFKDLFSVLPDVVVSLGFKDEINFFGNKDGTVTIKISEFLNMNALDLLPSSFLNSLNKTYQISENNEMDINVIAGKKNINTSNYEIPMINLLANIAPNIVLSLSKFLNSETYVKTDNLVYLILKDLFTNMDSRLKKINDKNNADNKSASLALTGMDSIFFNLLFDYNKNNRLDQDKINVDIRVTLNLRINIDEVVNSEKLVFINESLYKVFDYFIIEPGKIALKIINTLFDLKGKNTLDFKEPYISGDLNLDFSDYISVDANNLLNLLNFDLSDDKKEKLISFLNEDFKKEIQNILNLTINNSLPEYSLEKFFNRFSISLIYNIVPKEFDKSLLENATIEIQKAQFVFQFKEYVEGSDWKPQTKAITASDFYIYDSIRLHIEKMQIKVILDTEYNGTYEFLTKDNITFNITFSETDKNENHWN